MIGDTKKAIDLKTAQRLTLQACDLLDAEEVPLAECLGRIPVQSLIALRSLPGYDQSLRDGYAVSSGAGRPGGGKFASFRVVDEVAAGDTRRITLQPGESVRIMTGGLVPGNCNAIVPQELCRVRENRLEVLDRFSTAGGAFIHRKGSEVNKGRLLVNRGNGIGPQQLILLAGTGYQTVPVARRPLVSFFSSGSELVDGSGDLSAGQKFNANTPLLQGLINRCGAVVREKGLVKDDPEGVQRLLEQMSQAGCDILISTGGMGPGKFDLVEEAFTRAGGKIMYSSLHLRPGKSTLFGTLGSTLFFGLPGPPHAVHLLFNELVQPAILALQGVKLCRPQELKAHLEEDLSLPKRRMPRLKSGVLSFQGGQCRVRPVKSGEQSNCHIYCPASRRCLRTGEKVTVHLPRTG